MLLVESKVSATTSSFLKVQKRVKRSDCQRWRSKDGTKFYEWDELHGEIEVYNRQGEHVGVLDAEGKKKKPAVERRKISV